MGVMIDDLVTRGTREPYRMFTSRAEYRLMLREDNADLRLVEIGHELGLIDDDTLKDINVRKQQITREMKRIKGIVIKPSQTVNDYLERHGTNSIRHGIHLDQLLKRAQLSYDVVGALAESSHPISDAVARQVEIEIKYEGYIEKQHREIEKLKNLERVKIPPDYDFTSVYGLSNELKEKLSNIKPVTLGQASRIEGITPAAISVLLVALKAHEK
jgi:tRNA uridine 5-carboxymethylaminomethyl modification enzyme